MSFYDREEAGERLGDLLRGRGLEGAIVLGIPRGGVVVASKVAEALGSPLSVVVARKIRAPFQPELALGAVASDGTAFLDEALVEGLGIDEGYIESERAQQAEEAQAREERFDGRRRPNVQGKAVIIVDDGIATGATAIAAVRSMKAAGAHPVVLAAPVCSPDRARLLREEADEVHCLIEDPGLFAVGQYYVDFRPVEDEEVMRVLEDYERTRSEPLPEKRRRYAAGS